MVYCAEKGAWNQSTATSTREKIPKCLKPNAAKQSEMSSRKHEA